MTDKLVSEHQKYELEEKKLELLHKNFLLDLLGKIGLPLAVLVLSWIVYIGNKEQADARLRFEIDAKNKELAQKDQDIFLKLSDQSRAHDSAMTNFIQNNISLVFSNSSEERKKLTSLIEIAFQSPDDQKYLIEKISRLKQTTESTIESESQKVESNSKNYKDLGLSFAKQKDWENAALAFEVATFFNPNDAELWNFKAYSELQTNRLNEAYESISSAINLQPGNKHTQTLVIVNATKILCAQNKFKEASSYLQSAIEVFPEIKTTFYGDGEFKNKCGEIARL